jgi:hypothetical protein
MEEELHKLFVEKRVIGRKISAKWIHRNAQVIYGNTVGTVTCKIGFVHFARKIPEHRPHQPLLALNSVIPGMKYGSA